MSKLLFWRNKRQTAKLDEIEREALKTHQKNIGKIQESRNEIENLNVALKENHIIFQLVHTLGRTNE